MEKATVGIRATGIVASGTAMGFENDFEGTKSVERYLR